MNWEFICADMCRACMRVDGILLPMYGDDMIRKKNLPEKLTELTSVEIDKDDGLPTMLCTKCAYRTDAFYDFKQQVLATEKKLRKMFEGQISPIIKNEIVENYDEDSKISESTIIELKYDNNNTVIQTESDTNELVDDTLAENNGQLINQDSINLIQINELESSSIVGELGHIMPEMEHLITEESKVDTIKNQIPDTITEILQSQSLDYTIMYILDSELENVTTDEKFYLADKKKMDIQENYENMTNCIPEITTEVDDDDNDSASKMLTFKGNQEKLNLDHKSWQPPFEYEIIKTDKDSENDNKAVNDCYGNRKEAESEGSDSDYFADKDNILGSLNDTITKIKEIKQDGNVLQYQCTLCLQNYDELTGVLIHTVDNHVPAGGPFFCVVCEKDCESLRQLKTHVKTHTGQFPYTCFICNKSFSMKKYLKRHMICHSDFPRHRCPKCGVRFKVKSELEAHVTTHIHGAPYSCSQCPRLFNHKGNYKRHLISHLDPQGLHLPKYPCKVCGKRFLNNRTLMTHMRVHTGEKPFKCEVCSRSFSQQGNLLNHLRIHSNPRSYTCEVCGKRFNQRATLRDHSLLHTGEKPYVCNVCGAAFTFSAALRRHMWTHASDKPFGCEICDSRFIGKYDLKRHMRVHNDRPRVKGRKNVVKQEETVNEESIDQIVELQVENSEMETILIEQVLPDQDVSRTLPQEESEKENVDALFTLIHYD
ncbi:zinc finger protein 561 [Orussus abietinus]|uniref:zinc finger protein 561 n=1 Tax=Orussus abietinus TaxID=222816 RepID=UPI0006267F49|nr:zinc finger protein 561 [Orussus abietinus]